MQHAKASVTAYGTSIACSILQGPCVCSASRNVCVLSMFDGLRRRLLPTMTQTDSNATDQRCTTDEGKVPGARSTSISPRSSPSPISMGPQFSGDFTPSHYSEDGTLLLSNEFDEDCSSPGMAMALCAIVCVWLCVRCMVCHAMYGVPPCVQYMIKCVVWRVCGVHYCGGAPLAVPALCACCAKSRLFWTRFLRCPRRPQ